MIQEEDRVRKGMNANANASSCEMHRTGWANCTARWLLDRLACVCSIAFRGNPTVLSQVWRYGAYAYTEDPIARVSRLHQSLTVLVYLTHRTYRLWRSHGLHRWPWWDGWVLPWSADYILVYLSIFLPNVLVLVAARALYLIYPRVR